MESRTAMPSSTKKSPWSDQARRSRVTSGLLSLSGPSWTHFRLPKCTWIIEFLFKWHCRRGSNALLSAHASFSNFQIWQIVESGFSVQELGFCIGLIFDESIGLLCIVISIIFFVKNVQRTSVLNPSLFKVSI